MRRLITSFALLAGLTAPALADDVLIGWERRGAVYQRIDMDGGTTAACAALCNRDGQCQSWDWQQPGLTAPDAVCSLLLATPTPRRAPGHVTGLSQTLIEQIEHDGERAPSVREQAALIALTADRPH